MQIVDNSDLILQYGIASSYNYNTLESITIIVLEPYMKNSELKVKTISNNVSYITLWSSNKKDEGKIIYVQELDNKGNIVREVSMPIIYVKTKKDLTETLPKLAINSGNKMLYFGEKTSTPYGEMALYPKMSKKDFNSLQDNEHRFVEIRKYRE